ncbi:ADP-ribosylglycohydrolase family protein [Sphaerisporangium corydalis]|uniref:ADP-ribosylglycohydrolase family protein n=1 Tax=Sphaerisporangium corydalis TaxID=1441875 RepID=A0ABV9EGN1_9ACTN|nr:ADP-ribosylglycohydrolase family protein [Sphaerisporangium corydalis]
MSIFDDLNQNRPAGARLFVDRHTPCREFAERLNNDPAQQVVQVYVGVGGNGKSALLRTLQRRCVYRIPREHWEEIHGYPDEFFVDALSRAPGAEKVPVALLDFGAQPSGVNRPQEPLSALFMLKRQLAEAGVRTPRFDFAAVAYLHRSGADVRALVNELFPRSELLSAAGVADAFLQVPVVQVGTALFEWFNGRLDNLMEQRKLRRRVPPEVVAEVLALAPEPDLMEALPRLFCEDLRAVLTGRRTPHRIVLLFDTYEAVAGEGSRSRFGNVGGPRWIRSLLGNLPLADGAMAVVAGRAAPTWSRALTEPIPERYVKIDALGALPDRFARVYLEEAGVTDPELQDALVSYASDEAGLVHPLLLGLSTDVVLTAAERGRNLQTADFPADPELRDRERALAARLLSRINDDLEEAVAAVSAARSFDSDLFFHLGAQMDFPATMAVFRRLTAFSFVTPIAGEQRFALHQLLRRAIANIAPEVVLQAHEVLAAYYGAVPRPDEFTRRIEHIYHRAQLDPAAGVTLWLAEMDRVLALSRFDLCRSLLSVLGDLDMPSPEVAEACDYQVARAEIALGRWEEAEERLRALPGDAAHTHLLKGELAFVRGDFEAAKRHADQALAAGEDGAARLPYLMFSANMMLFLGRFDDGKRLCREGLAIFGVDGDGNTAVLWHSRLASIEFFSGDIEAAKEQLALAARRLDAVPEADRDRQAEAGLRHEEAVIAEAEGRAADALRGQAEALRIRREIADVRGVAHGLNGLGLAALQMGDAAEAEARFVESAVFARDLGERLLYAKVTRGRAEAATLDGRFDDADRLAAEALAEFEAADIPYDVVHAWITQARVHRARGDERAWLELTDRARREIEKEGFGSLYARCPEVRPPSAERIGRAMTAFAAGDAFGVPWEGSGPESIDADRIGELPAPAWGWPRGSTSDDTAQMLLVCELLSDTDGHPTAEAFLARLAAAEDEIRGIGPTTRRALDRFRETGALPEPTPGERATNGAAMRMLPVGWTTPATDDDLRRHLVETLAIGTHRAPEAIAAACIVAAMAAWAIEGVGLDSVLAAALTEADWVAGRYAEPTVVRAALAGTWTPPPDGITLDALGTVAAVVHILRTTTDLGSALRQSVLLGGDTDTVAALVGGIRGAMTPTDLDDLPWLPIVDFTLPTPLTTRLHRLRADHYKQ